MWAALWYFFSGCTLFLNKHILSGELAPPFGSLPSHAPRPRLTFPAARASVPTASSPLLCEEGMRRTTVDSTDGSNDMFRCCNRLESGPERSGGVSDVHHVHPWGNQGLWSKDGPGLHRPAPAAPVCAHSTRRSRFTVCGLDWVGLAKLVGVRFDLESLARRGFPSTLSQAARECPHPQKGLEEEDEDGETPFKVSTFQPLPPTPRPSRDNT